MAKDTSSPNHNRSERRLTSSSSNTSNASSKRRRKTGDDPTIVGTDEDNNATMIPTADVLKPRVSATPLDNPATVESERVVREFSQNTALYTLLALSLGTSRDGRGLREDLSKIRNKAHDLARQGKSLLVPRMKKPASDGDAQKEFERIFFIFCSCLECYCEQLLRTSDLISDFVASSTALAATSGGVGGGEVATTCSTASLHPQTPPCIFTGILDPYPSQTYLRGTTLTAYHVHGSRRSSTPNLRGSRRGSTAAGTTTDAEESAALHREITAIKDMILDIHSSVAINPWTVQPDFDPARYFSTDEALNSDDEEDDAGSETSSKRFRKDAAALDRNASVVQQSRRRCLCLVIVITVSIILFASVLGVCIAILA